VKYLVTGAAGFIGSALAARLLGEGHTVVGIDAMRPYYDLALKRANIAPLRAAGLTMIESDLQSIDLDEALDGVDVVFHEAGQPGVRSSWGSEFDVHLHDNIRATQRLLEAAQRTAGLKRLVYASSSSVYGSAARYPTIETDVPHPMSPYGVSKLAAEQLCTLYGRTFGVPTVSLRYFTVFGPGQRPDMAFSRFISAALSGGEISILGDGEQMRDFTFVEDVVDANLAAGVSTCDPGEVFNVSGGASITVNGALDAIESIVRSPLRRRYDDRVPGDVRRTGGSTDKIHAALGWQPSTSLEHGLRRQVEWLRARVVKRGSDGPALVSR